MICLGAMFRRERVIRTWDLTKYYGSQIGLESLYLEVAEGETFGLLGLSGSGKSTAIHLFIGLKRPTRGRAEVLGYDPLTHSYEIRQRSGCLLSNSNFHRELTGREFLKLCAGIRGVRKEQWQGLVDDMGLYPDQKIEQYSRSERQRIAFVQALMHDPPLLFLDDFTIGLDSPSKEVIYQLLEREKSKGKTIVLSTDSPEDVIRLCDRVGILLNGNLKYIQDMQELENRVGRRIRVTFREDVPLEDFIADDVSVISHKDREWVVAVKGDMGSLVKRLGQCSVRDVVYLEDAVEEALSGLFRDQISKPYL